MPDVQVTAFIGDLLNEQLCRTPIDLEQEVVPPLRTAPTGHRVRLDAEVTGDGGVTVHLTNEEQLTRLSLLSGSALLHWLLIPFAWCVRW